MLTLQSLYNVIISPSVCILYKVPVIFTIIVLIQTEDTFLTVERRNNNRWTVVYTDASWETKYGH